MARPYNNARPQNLRYTVGKLLDYMGRHKFLLLLVAVLVTLSALGNLLGIYMIRPVVNDLVAVSYTHLSARSRWRQGPLAAR